MRTAACEPQLSDWLVSSGELVREKDSRREFKQIMGTQRMHSLYTGRSSVLRWKLNCFVQIPEGSAEVGVRAACQDICPWRLKASCWMGSLPIDWPWSGAMTAVWCMYSFYKCDYSRSHSFPKGFPQDMNERCNEWKYLRRSEQEHTETKKRIWD